MAEIINIDHELGNLNEYTSTVGSPTASTDAGMVGTYGLDITISGATDRYATFDFVSTTHIRCRFYFDPASCFWDTDDEHFIFELRDATPTRVFALRFGELSGGYAAQIFSTEDGDTTWGNQVVVSDEEHWFEVEWKAATGVGQNNGYWNFWVGDSLEDSVASLDNDTFDIDELRIGAMEVDGNTVGDNYFDDIIANNDGSYIGPASVAGEVTWGHDTGVIEANIRDFTGNWAGTGAIAGAGDAEHLELETTENMVSEVVDTGTYTVSLFQNLYDGTGDDVDMDYRHGATKAACEGAGWNNYVGSFVSLGYVQIRMTSTL